MSGVEAAKIAGSSVPDRGRLECSLLYSEELGIDLSAGREDDYFRWFLASLLFGGHIGETIARRTYHAFIRHRLTTPRRILAAGWDFLVNPVMREGGYVRYDFSKSNQILRDCQKLVAEYDGKLWCVHEAACDEADLETRLLVFYGVGPVTVNIFLRELRPFWPKANPAPLPGVTKIADDLCIDLARYERKAITFARVEAGLVRLRHQHRRRQAA